ncbi:hypothetical protein llap_11469 [Limosa lapponica baueri]|uniref:Uncharacterized protein n=1 Tax=Limosa lapponica baueri TaxID=1758121 RepID=A0A2I0TWP4_LIMLA|nr:hypothetical protein llap_11469 [Limosa lapponica baueri]
MVCTCRSWRAIVSLSDWFAGIQEQCQDYPRHPVSCAAGPAVAKSDAKAFSPETFLCSLEASGGFHPNFKFWVLVDWLSPRNCSEDCDFGGEGSYAALITAIPELFEECVITGLTFIFCGSPFFRVSEIITEGWGQSWLHKGESSSKRSKEANRPFKDIYR